MGSERAFGLVFTVVFALIALWPVMNGNSPRWIVLILGAALLAVSILKPSVLRTPNRLWFKFGLFLGAIMAPIVMALVFLVAFLPIGLILRIFGKDLLSIRMDREAKSYWIARESDPKPMKLQY